VLKLQIFLNGLSRSVFNMDRTINLTLLLTLSCFLTSAFIFNWSPNDPNSRASSFLPEKDSTFSNSSTSSFESNPITTIIIPNEGSNLLTNSNSNNNNVTGEGTHQINPLPSINTSSSLVKNQSDFASSDNTLKGNASGEGKINDTLSDSQQKGKYLTDNNGIHYYNINNCSEKKGSSGIGEVSECEDAAKEMSEE
jgi:hypothetical protein